MGFETGAVEGCGAPVAFAEELSRGGYETQHRRVVTSCGVARYRCVAVCCSVRCQKR